MSLDLNHFNITHNLRGMWQAAGIYNALYESHGKTAAEILPTLEAGLLWLAFHPTEAKKHNAPNGWGLYEHALPWLAEVCEYFRNHPEEKIDISR